MPRRRQQVMTKAAASKKEVRSYRHQEKRKNNPEVGLAGFEKPIKEPPRITYQYDPHLDPQLVWSGKAEHTSFEVPTVSLHVHERVSSQAIIKTVKKNGEQQLEFTNLFADPQLPLSEAVEFYQHDVDWANRLILGDSLVAMNSLRQRELLGGQVQMIYVDPPYGVAYNSNFQPSIRRRDVKDAQDDSLTREPEQIKAYRDTWTLGIHSYLTYLRDRFLLCRDLLHETGSIFVQISDENVHRVRCVMDEVFGSENCVSQITFRKKLMPLGAKTLESMADHLLWYAKDVTVVKYRQLHRTTTPDPKGRWTGVELAGGARRPLTREEREDLTQIPDGARVFQTISQWAPSFSEKNVYDFKFRGVTYHPKEGQCWVTTLEKMRRLAECNRLEVEGESPRYVMFHDDFPYSKVTNPWDDTAPAQSKRYVVQTNEDVVSRCLLMSTDPGDLVFDPTCGSGTTAYVAEQWGRRWITCDTLPRGAGVGKAAAPDRYLPLL